MGICKKSFKLVWRYHQLLSGFLAKGHLSQVSRQSRRSLMIRVIMKWSWGLCTDLLAFALQLRKTPENLKLGDCLMKGPCNQSSPQMGSLSSKLQLSFYHPLCYNSRANCPLLQCLCTKSGILAGTHSYFVVSSFKCEGKNSCQDLIPNPRIRAEAFVTNIIHKSFIIWQWN